MKSDHDPDIAKLTNLQQQRDKTEAVNDAQSEVVPAKGELDDTVPPQTNRLAQGDLAKMSDKSGLRS